MAHDKNNGYGINHIQIAITNNYNNVILEQQYYTQSQISINNHKVTLQYTTVLLHMFIYIHTLTYN